MDIFEIMRGGDESKETLRDKVKSGYTHSIDGSKAGECGCSGRNTPDGAGKHEVVRSHAEVEAAEKRTPDLSEGVSLRYGMGSMKHAIDDGMNY